MSNVHAPSDDGLPPEIECAVYRALHPDLSQFGDEALRQHFRLHGRSEGRRANTLEGREAFAALVRTDMRSLEIGPFAKPMLSGPNVVHCDVLGQAELRNWASRIGLNPANVPHIAHVLGSDGLDGIPGQFDAVLSSHSIEHQPDLVLHLQQIDRKLKEHGGKYFVLVPDKRYCFDHYMAPSTIAEIVEAHHQRRTVHTLKGVIEHRALTTHNDARRHWNGDHGSPTIKPDLVRGAIDEWRAAKGGYVDVHAWYFTPDSFAENVTLLNQLGLTRCKVVRIYSTRYGAGEFWAVLST